jgi:hypothetical protein
MNMMAESPDLPWDIMDTAIREFKRRIDLEMARRVRWQVTVPGWLMPAVECSKFYMPYQIDVEQWGDYNGQSMALLMISH